MRKAQQGRAAGASRHPGRRADGQKVTARSSRRMGLAVPGAVALALAGAGVTYASTQGFGDNQVGTQYADGIQVSDNQIINPIGERLLTQFGKFMGSTVSPDGRFLAATSADRSVALQIIDLKSYKLIWTVGRNPAANQALKDTSVGQEGPTYSPDGRYLWLPQRDALTRFPVNADGTLGTPTSFKIPAQNGRSALVAKTVYSPDGSTLYAAINGQNTVVAINPETGAIEQTWPVGIAPRQLQFVGSKLYVSDEGGRRAQPGESTQDSYGTAVPADPYLGTSTTGAVSVIDTANPAAAVGTIPVGLHPTALLHSGNALFVVNTNSDTVSVIDTTKDQVVQTIDTQPWKGSAVGYAPDGIALTPDGHLLVTLGRANAVAVYRYSGDPLDPVSYIGLLPTDYYPASVADVDGQIVVTNTRGIDARGPAITVSKGPGTTPATGHGTHSTTASLTRFTLPDDETIAKSTRTVFDQNGWTNGGSDDDAGAGNSDAQANDGSAGQVNEDLATRRSRHAAEAGDGAGAGDGTEASDRADAVPVPHRIGDPSTIKHVLLIVKENRTYDQVYGDIPKGNGDPSLTQFGARVTPNQHALANQFGLYDNTYDIGTNSAEGHNWLMQGDNPEYTEHSVGEYTRSYDTEEDVLGHQRSGFLWTAAESAHNTARNYGEFEYTEGKPSGTWQQYYCAAQSVQKGGDPGQLTAPGLAGDYGSPIPSLNAIADHLSPPFDLSIPDIYRSQIFKQDIARNGLANFNMIWLSSDHTGGPTTPEAAVADGDLAVGQIVDAVSHSKDWKSTAIFVVEDDSQDGVDHVDGHRAPVQVISPWAQRGKVINTYYSQISVIRTIEQILGAEPLNQKVAAAAPMYDAFTDRPDDTPFNVVPNQVPLTEGIATPPACGLDSASGSSTSTQTNAMTAMRVSTRRRGFAAAWQRWVADQHLTGNGAVPDRAPTAQMNRYTWYATHRFAKPYPGDRRLYLPAQVPGADAGHSY